MNRCGRHLLEISCRRGGAVVGPRRFMQALGTPRLSGWPAIRAIGETAVEIPQKNACAVRVCWDGARRLHGWAKRLLSCLRIPQRVACGWLPDGWVGLTRLAALLALGRFCQYVVAACF